MARNDIILDDLVEPINHHGRIDAIGEAIGTLMNAAMRIERAEVLNAEPYQRTEQRRERANGFKPKTVHRRPGDIPLEVPQVRGDVSFYPSALTKGLQNAWQQPLISIAIPPQNCRSDWARVCLKVCAFLRFQNTSALYANEQLAGELERQDQEMHVGDRIVPEPRFDPAVGLCYAA